MGGGQAWHLSMAFSDLSEKKQHEGFVEMLQFRSI